MTDPNTGEQIFVVSEFVRRLQETSTGGRRLFRGQNTDKPLLPRIVRLAQEKGISFAQMKGIEQKMLERFRRESVPMLEPARELTAWELLSIAQHQGMPTRLLDWTANALAGLWFAVSTDPPNNEEHGVVWVLEAANEKTPKPSDDIFNLNRTFFFQPFHLDPRIVAQSAWFSVHRHDRRNDRFLPLEQHDRYRKALKRFTIPRERFDSLRQELRLLGVSQASMFPDLSGLGEDIKAEFIDSWRPLSSI